jgi:hypothetical protein
VKYVIHAVLEGTAIAVLASSTSGFTVKLDERASVTLDGWTLTEECKIAWSITGLSPGEHNLVLNTTAASALGKRQGDGPGIFNMLGFVYVSPQCTAVVSVLRPLLA